MAQKVYHIINEEGNVVATFGHRRSADAFIKDQPDSWNLMVDESRYYENYEEYLSEGKE